MSLKINDGDDNDDQLNLETFFCRLIVKEIVSPLIFFLYSGVVDNRFGVIEIQQVKNSEFY